MERSWIIPSGNKPVLLVCVCLPKYHPSPKSSSRSMSSILSPLARLSSSLLRASKSSARLTISTTSNFDLGLDMCDSASCTVYIRMTRRISPGRAFLGDAPAALYAIAGDVGFLATATRHGRSCFIRCEADYSIRGAVIPKQIRCCRKYAPGH